MLRERSDVGLLLTPRSRRRPDFVRRYPCWAADNGCYAQGAAFRLDAFLAWLDTMRDSLASCLFAVAPDVVGDAAATWERSRAVLPVLRALGYRAAFVAQDGQEALPVPWDAFDALFVGGTTEWKLSEHAYRLIAEAKRRGKWVHVGRVNSLIRIRAAACAGADSVDGTQLAFRPDARVRQVTGWLDQLLRQPALPLLGPAAASPAPAPVGVPAAASPAAAAAPLSLRVGEPPPC